MLVRRALLAVALCLLSSGCGAIRFHRAWTGYEPSTERDGMVGRWRGEWRSESNGHAGGLRCVMTRCDERHYHAWFYSTYGPFFFFQHEVRLHAVREADGSLRFSGAQDLGAAIGGVYRYAGTAGPDSFRATFSAENDDHGVFEMTRID